MKYLLILSALFFISTNVQAQTKENPSPFFYDERTTPIFYEIDTIPKPDSAKIYYKRKVLYQALFNQELNRLNRFKKPQITQRLLDYQDSAIKFKLLLSKYKSK